MACFHSCRRAGSHVSGTGIEWSDASGFSGFLLGKIPWEPILTGTGLESRVERVQGATGATCRY